MKIKSDMWQVTSDKNRRSQRGMALVITLIMLSVTLIMAIAFLAVARRERISVSTSTDTTTARLAADTALANAQAQIIANIYSSTNATLNSYNVLVSTNFINPAGFNNAPGNFLTSPNNVNYYYPNGNILAGADFDQNVANLLFLPRAPVMITPAEQSGRFYLDFNRNGVFEDTGWVTNVDANANGIFDANGNSTIYQPAGDPQWVGILERPGLQHGPDNKFISRYAFICLPVGDSLDLNAIHNQVLNRSTPISFNDGFFRNQGVGSWELNLAAFLADLNTNVWCPNPLPDSTYYFYRWPGFNLPNLGRAFDNARALVAYRYTNDYSSLASANQLFFNAANVLPFDNIDNYGDSPLQITTTNIDESFPANRDNTAIPWAGADNTNHFFTPGDLFDRTKTQLGVPGGIFGFSDWLNWAGTNTYNTVGNIHPTYDRYTFYRMLDQLGTDTLPEPPKLNLNYRNAVLIYNADNTLSSVTIVPDMETNLIGWLPLDFFNAAVDQMLRVYTTNWFQAGPSNYMATYYGVHFNGVFDRYTGFGLTNVPFFGMTNQVPAFGLTNIPVLVNGTFVYSPAVNRILQLAANIYDAGTNDFYPHVFRPRFIKSVQGDIFIAGYQQIVSVSPDFALPASAAPVLSKPIDPLLLPSILAVGVPTTDLNVFGLPWILGAKKNLPNFNQFYSRSDFQVTRKLQVSRTKVESYNSATSRDFATNELFILGITNHIGYSFWNSYATNYPGGPVTVVARDWLAMQLDANGALFTANGLINPPPAATFATNFIMSPWPGSGWDTTADPGQRVPSSAAFLSGTFDYTVLPLSSYPYNGGFVPGVKGFDITLTSLPVFPALQLLTTNQFQAYMLDGTHVIDYVQFNGPSGSRNLAEELRDVLGVNNAPYQQWYTNGYKGQNPPVTLGVVNQILVSQKGPSVAPNNSWATSVPNMPAGSGDPVGEAASFGGFFGPYWSYKGVTYTNRELTNQAPYTPSRTAYNLTVWQANDPLVHYLVDDLNDANADVSGHSDDPVNDRVWTVIPSSLTIDYSAREVGNERYQPWGRIVQLNSSSILNVDKNAYNLSYKDPLAYGSDNWDFPANKYPTVGWLGRVHRGTPWQTVYLKATNLLQYSENNQPAGQNTWGYWTGNFNVYDAGNSKPIQDELLFDLFTAAPNANAARGTLSVNQKNTAAWSAVFSGLVVISNASQSIDGYPNWTTRPMQSNLVIDPVGVDQINSRLNAIINGPDGINSTRTNLYPTGFTRVGDILRVPALSDHSPYFNRLNANAANDRLDFDLSDEIYEWLPQQIMGLLRPTGPSRFVIYSLGQTLKPAPDGTALGGGAFFGLVTNYQVAAESVTRAVVTIQPVVTNNAFGPVTNYSTKVESFNVLPAD